MCAYSGPREETGGSLTQPSFQGDFKLMFIRRVGRVEWALRTGSRAHE